MKTKLTDKAPELADVFKKGKVDDVKISIGRKFRDVLYTYVLVPIKKLTRVYIILPCAGNYSCWNIDTPESKIQIRAEKNSNGKYNMDSWTKRGQNGLVIGCGKFKIVYLNNNKEECEKMQQEAIKKWQEDCAMEARNKQKAAGE